MYWAGYKDDKYSWHAYLDFEDKVLYLGCNLDISSYDASCASGSEGKRKIITYKNSGQRERHLPITEYSKSSTVLPENFILHSVLWKLSDCILTVLDYSFERHVPQYE